MIEHGLRNANDNYWEAGEGRGDRKGMRHRLRSAGYRVSDHASSDALYGITQRIDTHQICYERCSSAELSKFTRDRGITVTLTPKETKEPRLARMAVEDTLYAADQKIKFERFHDLPPELRNSIYDYAMAHFPDQLITPSVPPLTRVCRQLRSEVLPLFYASHSFVLAYRLSRKTGEYRASGNLASFLMALANNDGLRHIRRLSFKVTGWDGLLSGKHRVFASSFDVTIRDADGESSSFELLSGWQRSRALSAAVSRRLQYLLDWIDSRAEGRSLTMLDLRSFRRVGDTDMLSQNQSKYSSDGGS